MTRDCTPNLSMTLTLLIFMVTCYGIFHPKPEPTPDQNFFGMSLKLSPTLKSSWTSASVTKLTKTKFKFNNHCNKSLIFFIIVALRDFELNPGPRTPRYPCGFCSGACTWKTPAVACDTCDRWYHTTCVAMKPETYKSITNCSWHCLHCALPNFSSSLFQSSSLSLSNSFSLLSDESQLTESNPKNFQPNSASTPKKKILSTKNHKPKPKLPNSKNKPLISDTNSNTAKLPPQPLNVTKRPSNSIKTILGITPDPNAKSQQSPDLNYSKLPTANDRNNSNNSFKSILGLTPDPNTNHIQSADLNNSNHINPPPQTEIIKTTPDISSNHNPTPDLINSNLVKLSPPSENKISSNSIKTILINFQKYWNKKEEFAAFVNSENPDVIIGTETWLYDKILNQELMLDNYIIYRRDRDLDPKFLNKNINYGGVMVCVKKNLISTPLFKALDNESIYIKIKFKGSPHLIVAAVYRPPSYNDQDFARKTCRDINNIVNKNKNSTIWIAGDFNLPDINWTDLTVPGTQYNKQLNNIFLDTFLDLGLKQVINIPTRENNTLDVLFTNRPNLIKECSSNYSISDHNIININSNIKPARIRPVKRLIHLWKKVNETEIKKSANNFKDAFLNKHCLSDDPNQLWESIKNSLKLIINEHVPTKTSTSSINQPWINTLTKKLIRKKKKIFKKMKTCKTEKSKSKLKSKFQELKKETQKECRKAHNNYLNDIINNGDLNKKKFWNFIKNKNRDISNTISELKNHLGNLTQDSESKANILNDQFFSVFSDNKDNFKGQLNPKTKTPTMSNIIISQ